MTLFRATDKGRVEIDPQEEVEIRAEWTKEEALKAASALDQIRLDEIDEDIRQDTVINQLKAMTKTEFNAWWSANVTTAAQANSILKRLAFREIRR